MFLSSPYLMIFQKARAEAAPADALRASIRYAIPAAPAHLHRTARSSQACGIAA